MTRAQLRDFFDFQATQWPMAAANIKALANVKRKPFRVGQLEGWVQYNPARAVSTLAKVDKNSIRDRKCFLCRCNRPPEQKALELSGGEFELLINPFPVLPYHFTIAHRNHTDQVFLKEAGEALAGELEGMAVFYNDSGAGASAPDHLHFQAVPYDSLPLLQLLEVKKDLQLPFRLITDVEELENTGFPMNIYLWKSPRTGEIKSIGVARKAHRPDFYFKNPPERRAVSPGAVEMAGIIVTPFEEDFESITDKDIEEIYRQVSL